jgi:hypothetical protein
VKASDFFGNFLAYFDFRTLVPNAFDNRDIGFRLVNPYTFAGPPVPTPIPVTSADESQPALSVTGRYIAWVRHDPDGHDRLFVREPSTFTVLNPNGVDLGVVATRGIGSVSLYERAVLTTSSITRTGTVSATLASASSIGILVQRIVGVTRELGEKRFELEPVGRVPLGFFEAGELHTQWNLRVGGEPLPPGNYLVTLRAVEGDVIRELGQSQVISIWGKASPAGGTQ